MELPVVFAFVFSASDVFVSCVFPSEFFAWEVFSSVVFASAFVVFSLVVVVSALFPAFSVAWRLRLLSGSSMPAWRKSELNNCILESEHGFIHNPTHLGW